MNKVLPPSLLPYLQAGKNDLRLEISLHSRENSYLEKSPFPFLLINDSSPFERVLEANFITDAGGAIQRVFLLQQSDNYRYLPDEMWPLTNQDIDQHWGHTIKSYSSQSTEGHSNPILLAGQIQENGMPTQFQSLFYCAFKHVYFHPPCPKCGDLLHLCCDDTLLAEANISPYTTSLKRYLYCPKCQEGLKNAQFYAHSRQGNDPADLKDRRDLVNDFGHLVLKSETSNGFPCMNCPELTVCYGTDHQVMSRIVPYSFYPFYALVFEAATMSAPDFLSLISGASLEMLKARLADQQAHGRLHCLQTYEDTRPTPSNFMFGSDGEKGFLEILYLKLSFLGELIHNFLSDSNHAIYCDAALSLDRVWVRLANQAGQLPQYWNFRLSTLDIWSDLNQRPHLSKYPPAYGHHFLGTIWFYALLVNNRQSVEDVWLELDRHLQVSGAQDQVFSQHIQIEDGSAVFAPENIFWDPTSKQVDEKWWGMWRKALDLGGAILAAAFNSERKWSPDEFWLEYNALRAEIKSELFGQQDQAIAAELASEDSAIADILIRLHAKWRREIQPPATPPTEDEIETVILPGPPETEDLAETQILTPGDPVKTSLSSEHPASEEDTLILPSYSQPPSDHATPPSDDELIQETVILSPGHSAPLPPGSGSANADNDEDDLQETVVLSPGRSPGIESGTTARTSLPGDQPNTHQQPGGDKNQLPLGTRDNEDSPQDDDILTETVILQPGKHKGFQDE
jgi:hypothetical protein